MTRFYANLGCFTLISSMLGCAHVTSRTAQKNVTVILPSQHAYRADVHMQLGTGMFEKKTSTSMALRYWRPHTYAYQCELVLRPVTKMGWNIQTGTPNVYRQWLFNIQNTYFEYTHGLVVWRLGSVLGANWGYTDIPPHLFRTVRSQRRRRMLPAPSLWGIQAFWQKHSHQNEKLSLSAWMGNGYLGLDSYALFFRGDPWNRFRVTREIWRPKHVASPIRTRTIHDVLALSQSGLSVAWRLGNIDFRCIWEHYRHAVRLATLGQPIWIDVDKTPIASHFSGFFLQAYDARREKKELQRSQVTSAVPLDLQHFFLLQFHAYRTDVWSLSCYHGVKKNKRAMHTIHLQTTSRADQYVMLKRLASFSARMLRTTRAPMALTYRSSYQLMPNMWAQSRLKLHMSRQREQTNTCLRQALTSIQHPNHRVVGFAEYAYLAGRKSAASFRYGFQYTAYTFAKLQLQLTQRSKNKQPNTLQANFTSHLQWSTAHWFQRLDVTYKLKNIRSVGYNYQLGIWLSGQFVLSISKQINFHLRYRTLMWSDQGFFHHRSLFFEAKYAP